MGSCTKAALSAFFLSQRSKLCRNRLRQAKNQSLLLVGLQHSVSALLLLADPSVLHAASKLVLRRDSRRDPGRPRVDISDSNERRHRAFTSLAHGNRRNALEASYCGPGSSPTLRMTLPQNCATCGMAPSSGEEPAPPRYRAGVASMAWGTTR